MKRSIIFLLCIALVLGVLCGCTDQSTEQSSDSQTLSEALRAEIVAFYGENASDNENIVAGKRFCGTYHGYTILLSGSDMDVYTDVEIGGFRFVWPNALRLCAYKDGAEYGVRGLYEAGTLTRADMEQIHAIYLLYYEERFQKQPDLHDN